MKHLLLTLLAAAGTISLSAQTLTSADKRLDHVFDIATSTLYNNVRDSIINAGGSYTGEWTRDIAINSWNASNLLLPEVSRHSLWCTTTDHRTRIGHQYWDHIIWVIGAYDHYLTTRDEAFLRQAYTASRNTMQQLESEAFDSRYGLFTGPSVFNDGIAGYESPIYEQGRASSYVLDYPNARHIMCLSTNCVYYAAYLRLADMARLTGDASTAKSYLASAATLKGNIRNHLWDTQQQTFYYLIDHNGTPHRFQEGLGLSFAVLFGIADPSEAAHLVAKAHVTPYGLPSIYPHFQRFSDERPGRHNTIIWPFVNAFWAEATLQTGARDKFIFEVENLCRLVTRSNDCFYEIYDSRTGAVNGGWQTKASDRIESWESIHHQTWSATGFLRMVIKGIFGIRATEEGLVMAPDAELMHHFGISRLDNLRFMNIRLHIRRIGNGHKIHRIKIEGQKSGKERIVLRTVANGSPHTDIHIDIITR